MTANYAWTNTKQYKPCASLVPRPGNEAIQSTSMNTLHKHERLCNCIYKQKCINSLLTVKYRLNYSSKLLYSSLNGYSNGLKHSTIITT